MPDATLGPPSSGAHSVVSGIPNVFPIIPIQDLVDLSFVHRRILVDCAQGSSGISDYCAVLAGKRASDT